MADTENSAGAADWPQRRQDVAAVLWPSFLAAALATVLCFAFLDPAVLPVGPAATSGKTAVRMTGYAVGFFFFWTIAAVSSWLTLYLIRSARRHP